MNYKDNYDIIIGIKLANIFKGLSQINNEITTLDDLSSEYKEFIPAELNNVKQESVSSVLDEEIDEKSSNDFSSSKLSIKS